MPRIELNALNEEERPLYDALIRVAAASWPYRDESGETILAEAIDELVKLRKERAALREIAQAVIAQEPARYGDVKLDVAVFYNDNTDEWECCFCNGGAIRKDYVIAGFDHEEECPITRLRALLEVSTHEQ